MLQSLVTKARELTGFWQPKYTWRNEGNLTLPELVMTDQDSYKDVKLTLYDYSKSPAHSLQTGKLEKITTDTSLQIETDPISEPSSILVSYFHNGNYVHGQDSRINPPDHILALLEFKSEIEIYFGFQRFRQYFLDSNLTKKYRNAVRELIQ